MGMIRPDASATNLRQVAGVLLLDRVILTSSMLRAKPRSVILTRSMPFSSRMLAGLMSRCGQRVGCHISVSRTFIDPPLVKRIGYGFEAGKLGGFRCSGCVTSSLSTGCPPFDAT
jgi:hypothetical protein